MDKTGGAAGSNDCGGIAGYLAGTNLSRCVFGGKIDIPATFNAATDSHIGGLVGNYRTIGTADNCSVTGDIAVYSAGASQVYLGGVAGELYGNGDLSRVVITNTSYSGGAILLEAASTGAYQRVGGFVGSIMRYGSAEN
jgi:hypothetical protein